MALAPWCVNEKWEFGVTPKGHAYAKVTGREPCPAKYKSNPLWWIRNDFQQQVDEAPWFHPDWPEWRRQIAWSYLRNPFQNMSLFVLGVADRNYTVEVQEGWNDPMVIQRNDLIDPKTNLPGEGKQRHIILFEDGSSKQWSCDCKNPTPTSKGYVHSFGWQPSGLFEIKWNSTSWTGQQVGNAPVSTLTTV